MSEKRQSGVEEQKVSEKMSKKMSENKYHDAEWTKKEQALREAMGQIHLSEQSREQILTNVRRHAEERKSVGVKWRRNLAVAAVIALVVGVGSIPAHAVLENFVQMRLESIPKEELRELDEMISNSRLLADGQSREFSETENERYRKLSKSYREGKFPKEKLLLVEQEADIVPGELCYVKESCFYSIPEREMTDEELLQIIDFKKTINYALRESDHAKKYREEEKKEQDKLRERLLEEGGISEEEALRIVQEKVRERIGDQVDEVEWSVRLRDVKYASYKRKGTVWYTVNACYNDGYCFCSYEVDAADGCIMDEFLIRDDER